VEKTFFEPAGQNQLFPLPKRDLLVFLVFPLISEEEFTRTLELTKPAVILELRRSPRFDIGQLNRHEAFRWFKTVQSKYYDLSSALSPDEPNPSDPVQLVRAFLNRPGSQVVGPIMFLMNDVSLSEGDEESSVTTQITRLFASVSKHPWEAVELPYFA
jgi:hypothetical protein